jgi:hypothetical protein
MDGIVDAKPACVALVPVTQRCHGRRPRSRRRPDPMLCHPSDRNRRTGAADPQLAAGNAADAQTAYRRAISPGVGVRTRQII